jgi:hypothetical protein
MTHAIWRRVSKADRCRICGKPDWCLRSADGSAVICARVEGLKRCGEAGWLHRLRYDGRKESFRRFARTISITNPANSVRRFDDLARRYTAAVDASRLTALAHSLGLSAASLLRLGVGWSVGHGAWTFPMSDSAGRVVGIRLRLPDGRKLSIRGGREGLFIPSDLAPDGPLLISEGPTDCTALLDLGFNAFGRPSCRGGVRLIVELLRQRNPTRVVIVADADAPGQAGAADLARRLRLDVPSVRLIWPPDPIKDTRDWVRSGATRESVEAAINAAEDQQLVVRATQNRRRNAHVKRFYA